MRPVFALLVAISILGGIKFYMEVRPRSQPVSVEIQQRMAKGQFAVEVTLSFDAGPDPFALDVSDAPSVLVRLAGADVLRRQDNVPAGQLLRVDDVTGVVAGDNEFLIQATPQAGADRAHALRVRVLRDGNPIAQSTLWSEPGDPVAGVIVVDVPDQFESPHQHDHAEGQDDSA